MNTAGKVVIGLLVVGGIGAAVLLSSPATAHASPKPLPPPPPVPPTPGPPLVPAGQPQDHDPGPGAGGVIVAPPSSAPAGTPIGVVPPPAGAIPGATPGGGVSLPLPGGGTVTVPPGTLPNVTTGPGGGTVLTLPGGGQVPLSPGLPGVPSAPGGSVSLPPLVVTATGEPTAPGDTIQVAQAMLAAERNGTSWRSTAIPGLADWQRARGLTPDGMAGTGTMLRMAQEIGAIPIVRAWPKGSTIGGHWLPDYKASLQQIANSKTGLHADLLRASAAREEGQGFGTPPKLISTLLTLEG